MQLRYESIQPYKLFPVAKPGLFEPQPDLSQKYIHLQRQQQQQLEQQQQQEQLERQQRQQRQQQQQHQPQYQRHYPAPLLQPYLYQPQPPQPQLPTTYNDCSFSLFDIPRKHLSSADLPNFAASMVYVMWYGRSLPQGPLLRSHSPPPLVDASKPSPAFKKFCQQVLATTQLSQEAVFLGLKYVNLLLRKHPKIEGADGSEYRLLIVALMLANKFLDDMTFTNKTWSDVCGMKLHDLNTMEAEFLEAIQYKLFVKDSEFHHWSEDVLSCVPHVERMANSGPLNREDAVQSVLTIVGLRAKAFTDDIDLKLYDMSYHEEALAKQQQAVMQAAAEAARLQQENLQRQYHLSAFARAQALDCLSSRVLDPLPLRPHRKAAPPPPISRTGEPAYDQKRPRSAQFGFRLGSPLFQRPISMPPSQDHLFSRAPSNLLPPLNHGDGYRAPSAQPLFRDNWEHGIWAVRPDPITPPALTPSWYKDFL